MHPDWGWTVVTLCRRSDLDRSSRFFQALERLHAVGRMGDLDDSPEQLPLPKASIQEAINSLLPKHSFDLTLTHSPFGEYTTHRRHEETARATLTLWEQGAFSSNEVWLFAYEDGGGGYLPRPLDNADRVIELPRPIWQEKYEIITKIYGFPPDSFEARTTPRTEAFWRLRWSADAKRWLSRRLKNENTGGL